MKKRNKSLINLLLGVASCLLLVGIATPAISQGAVAIVSAQIGVSTRDAIATQLSVHLQEAEIALLAQAEPEPNTRTAPSSGAIVRYVAVLSGKDVVPSASTSAFGAAGAALVGNRLVIRGDYSGLTSPLRDYATDPLNPPNPNITSGIHVHRGELSKNGPFQYALTVEPRADQLSGRFMGEYTLTEEQLQALSNGTLYVDLHTKQNRAGELRGIFKAY